MTDRNKLIEDNLGLVGIIVSRFSKSHPYVRYVDLDDYAQEGRIALMKCAERWDPGRNAKFNTYASHRIKGSMLDEYRRRHCHRHTDGTTTPKVTPFSIDAANKVHQQNGIIDDIKCPYDTPEQSANTQDQIKALINLLPRARQERDEFIIRELMDGKTNQEIANTLGMHYSRISQIRREVRETYKRMTGRAA